MKNTLKIIALIGTMGSLPAMCSLSAGTVSVQNQVTLEEITRKLNTLTNDSTPTTYILEANATDAYQTIKGKISYAVDKMRY